MSGKIAVVKPYYLKEEAYEMGHSEFSGVEVENPENVELSHFKEYARWANIIAPKLRAMAGFEDSIGKGTYQGNRKVAAIEPGCEEDEPADAQLIEAQYLYQELVECWDMGARDGATGTYDPDSALV